MFFADSKKKIIMIMTYIAGDFTLQNLHYHQRTQSDFTGTLFL